MSNCEQLWLYGSSTIKVMSVSIIKGGFPKTQANMNKWTHPHMVIPDRLSIITDKFPIPNDIVRENGTLYFKYINNVSGISFGITAIGCEYEDTIEQHSYEYGKEYTTSIKFERLFKNE